MGFVAPLLLTVASVALTSALSPKPQAPAAPPAPPPLPPAPVLQDPAKAEETAKDEQRRRLVAAQANKTKTILTSPVGDTESPNIQRKTLLGMSAN